MRKRAGETETGYTFGNIGQTDSYRSMVGKKSEKMRETDREERGKKKKRGKKEKKEKRGERGKLKKT